MGDYTIKCIDEPELKSAICLNILQALPEWFGMPSAITSYQNDVRIMPFYACFNKQKPVGFIACKKQTPQTMELYVMGVLKDDQHQGIGTRLFKTMKEDLTRDGYQYLTVKTLADSVNHEGYQQTRQFYLKMGFIPLEVFPSLWDKNNPCLMLVTKL